MARLKVIYLSRKINDPRYSWAFFDSLRRHRSGVEFDLVLILKGYKANEFDESFVRLRPDLQRGVDIVRYDDADNPTQILFDVARRIDGDRFLFLTSWSRILADGWLRYYADTFERAASCGLVGATGGYESLNEETPFPNVGIRTNAFMVPRDLFVSLDPGDLSARLGGNLFEAGPNGMTKQIVARGFRPFVVDRFGEYWRSEEWPFSLTYRAANQERLLIADNRTFDYERTNLRKRRALAIRNWGTDSVVVDAPLLGRAALKFRWRHPRGYEDIVSDIRKFARNKLRLRVS